MGKISQNTLDRIYHEVDMHSLVNDLLPDGLKKGKACCPFHNEKSASFGVGKGKNFAKCFGCGWSGGPLQFVMEYKGLSFVEAVEWLADYGKIQIEWEDQHAEPDKEKESKYRLYGKILRAALNHWKQASCDDPFHEYIASRGIDEETAEFWDLGYAPDDWSYLKTIINKSGYLPDAIDLGLIKDKDGKYFDAFRNRLIIPIVDHKGFLVGFGGRYMGPESKEIPKYLNSPESLIYNKSKVLYGLFQAQKDIRLHDVAIITEGYLDVISLHAAGCPVAVAACGTAFTEEQAALISRHTQNVILFYDADSAGEQAARKTAKLLLQRGFKVRVFFAEEGDPDDFAKYYDGPDLLRHLKEHSKPAIDHFIEAAFSQAKTPEQTDDAARSVADMLTCVSGVMQQEYIKQLSKRYKIGQGVWKDYIEDIRRVTREKSDAVYLDEHVRTLPKGIDVQFYSDHGWAPLIDKKNPSNTGYYFMSKDGYYKVANFVITPLFHIYGEDNKRMLTIDKGDKRTTLLMESKSLISMDRFEGEIFQEGGYVFRNGSKNHLQILMEHYGDQFPLCYELHKLGWQPEGFFAFSNVIYNGQLQEYNDLGIVQHKDKNYLSAAIAYNNTRRREVENEYESEKYLTHVESKVKFDEWADLFAKVYPEHCISAIGFALVTLFRDVVVKSTKVPILYLYGMVESGKSAMGESVCRLFYSGKNGQGEMYKPFNLNQGTDYAFFNRLERFVNCPAMFNEFDENAIPENWFRAFKSIFDGEGREKGSGKKNRTTTQQILCTVILAGQYLTNKDDNSVLSRCIPCSFKKKPFTTEEIEQHKRLTEWEERGLSGILVELLKLRPLVVENFADRFGEDLRWFKNYWGDLNIRMSTRVMKNCAALYSMLHVFADHVRFPFDLKQAREHFIEIMKTMNDVMSQSDSLADFWSFVEFLLDVGKLKHDVHLKVEVAGSVTLYKGEERQVKNFDAPRRLLFIRMKHVHKLYEELYRKNRGKTGLNYQTLTKYAEEHESFIGKTPHVDFKTEDGHRNRTAAYVFDYELLKVNLDRGEVVDEAQIEMELVVATDPEEVIRLGASMLKFKAGRFNQRGEQEMYTCYYSAQEHRSALSINTRIAAKGYVQERSFNKEGTPITWKEFSITGISKTERLHPEAAPADTQLTLDDETDDLPF